jgi:endo-1,4-beta-xylanase
LQAENEIKFGFIRPRPGTDPNPDDSAAGDALFAARSHNMLVRGHTLVWHNQVSAWVKNGNFTPPQLATILQDYIWFGDHALRRESLRVGRGQRGLQHRWLDALPIWYEQPGISGSAGAGTNYIEQALKGAHQADPNAKLFYNDYDAGEINPKSDAIYAMAADFKRHGVAHGGVGFETHISLKFDDAAKLESFARNLERLAKLGYELDIRLNHSTPESLAAEARLYREITKLCVEQSA